MRKPEQNGVIHPARTTLAGDAWDLFDSMGRSFTVRKAIELGAERGIAEKQIRTELCYWRKYHGIRM